MSVLAPGPILYRIGLANLPESLMPCVDCQCNRHVRHFRSSAFSIVKRAILTDNSRMYDHRDLAFLLESPLPLGVAETREESRVLDFLCRTD